MKTKHSKSFYYLLSFIEGACVMATELLGAKMLAPFFGSSLYVWATVLAMTLGGLALGYFFGGILSYKYKKPNTLFYVLLIGAVFNMLMPFTSKAILVMLVQYSLLPSIIISCLLFLLPPVFMMGMVSPLIIARITENIDQSGKAAGSVYAISTVGGIIATFLTGFYIIPTFGLTSPAILNGILLGAIPLFMLVRQNKLWLLFVVVLTPLTYKGLVSKKPHSDIKIVYESEGLLGQILVADHPNYDKQTGGVSSYSRILYFNRIGQSMLNLKTGETFNYVAKFDDIIKELKDKSNVLLLGLGGGTLANILINKDYEVDACELDRRVLDVAKKYFFLDNKVNTAIDDARHFIKSSTKQYDIIVFDVFKGEENPNHVFTVESLNETKEILKPGGVIIVNANGFFSSSAGIGTRSIYKTFIGTGFSVEVFPTSADTVEENRNLLMVASLDKENIPENKNYLAVKVSDTSSAVILKDNYPLLDILNMEANKIWRQGYISNSIAMFNKRNVPLFK